MLKIGTFSRLGGVTIKTLHYYDHLGLLKPSCIDPLNGYRFYHTEQLSRLNQILALKEMDLSLEQIALILAGELSSEQLESMLRHKYAELQQQIGEKYTQLQQVSARLRQLEQELCMDAPVTIKEIPAQRVLAYRTILPDPTHIGPIFDEANQSVAAAHIPLAPAPWLALYYHDEYREVDLDFEIAIPVQPDFNGTLDLGGGRILRSRDLPGYTMACIDIHLRQQSDVLSGNQALARWCAANGYEYEDAPCRESYDNPPLEDGTIIYESQFPVKKK